MTLACLVLLSCQDKEPSVSLELPRADEYRSERAAKVLAGAEQVLRSRGLAEDGEPWRGFLVDQGSEVRELSLSGDHCYVLAAVGTGALRELDLRLFDSEGGEVAQDSVTGQGAALQHCPPNTGTYYVAVVSAAGAGLFAVQRFAGPPGLPVRLDDLFQSVAVPDESPARGAELP